MADTLSTRYTLIQRVRDVGNQQAWREFEGHYKRFISYVLRQMRVPTDDIEDLTQQIMINLTKHLESYDKQKGRFRTWMTVVIRNSALNYYKAEAIRPSNQHRSAKPLYDTYPLKAAEIERIIDDEWATYIATTAMERLEPVFTGHALEVFKLSMEGVSTEAIAERTGLTVASVYTLRKRVKQRFYEQIRVLKDTLE